MQETALCLVVTSLQTTSVMYVLYNGKPHISGGVVGPVACVAWHPYSTLVAIALQDNSIHFFDVCITFMCFFYLCGVLPPSPLSFLFFYFLLSPCGGTEVFQGPQAGVHVANPGARVSK